MLFSRFSIVDRRSEMSPGIQIMITMVRELNMNKNLNETDCVIIINMYANRNIDNPVIKFTYDIYEIQIHGIPTKEHQRNHVNDKNWTNAIVAQMKYFIGNIQYK